MASSTPPSGSGRNSPAPLSTNPADQTQNTSTPASSVPIVNVSESNQLPDTHAAHGTAASRRGSFDASGPVTRALSTPVTPVAQMTDAQIMALPLTSAMLDNARFSDEINEIMRNQDIGESLGAFGSTLDMGLELYIRHEGEGHPFLVHVSGCSIDDMNVLVANARSDEECAGFIRYMNENYFYLLTVAHVRQILGQQDARTDTSSVPSTMVHHRRSSDPDPDGDTAASRVTTALPIDEPLYADIDVSGRTSVPETQEQAAVSLDDINLPPFTGPVPTQEQLGAQLDDISAALTVLDQQISGFETSSSAPSTSSPDPQRSTHSSAPDIPPSTQATQPSIRFTSSTVSGTGPESLYSTVSRPSAVSTTGASTVSTTGASTVSTTGTSTVSTADEAADAFPFVQATSGPAFVPPARRGSTASIDLSFDTLPELSSTDSFVDSTIIPSSSTSQTGVRSAAAPYASSLMSTSSTQFEGGFAQDISALTPEQLRALTATSETIQSATLEDLQGLSVEQISALSRAALIRLNQHLHIVADGRSATWSDAQVQAFRTATAAVQVRRDRSNANRRTEQPRTSGIAPQTQTPSVQGRQTLPQTPQSSASTVSVPAPTSRPTLFTPSSQQTRQISSGPAAPASTTGSVLPSATRTATFQPSLTFSNNVSTAGQPRTSSTSTASATATQSPPLSSAPPQFLTSGVTQYRPANLAPAASSSGLGTHGFLTGLISGQPGAVASAASDRDLTAPSGMMFNLPNLPQSLHVPMARRYAAQQFAAPSSNTLQLLDSVRGTETGTQPTQPAPVRLNFGNRTRQSTSTNTNTATTGTGNANNTQPLGDADVDSDS